MSKKERKEESRHEGGIHGLGSCSFRGMLCAHKMGTMKAKSRK